MAPLCPATLECNGATSWPCPSGKFCPGGNTSTCPAGYFCAAGASAPEQCPAGTFSAMSAANCTICTLGNYCPSISAAPIACPLGSLCNVIGLTAPQPCPAGQYCAFPNASAICPATYYCPQNTSVPTLCSAALECNSPVAVADDSWWTGSNIGKYPAPIIFLAMLLVLWTLIAAAVQCCGGTSSSKNTDAKSTSDDELYLSSSQVTSTVYMNRVAALADKQTPENKMASCSWWNDERVWQVALSSWWHHLLSTHPYLSVYFHRSSDLFNTFQRLFVSFALLFSYLAINAIFFGTAAGVFILSYSFAFPHRFKFVFVVVVQASEHRLLASTLLCWCRLCRTHLPGCSGKLRLPFTWTLRRSSCCLSCTLQ